DYCGVEPKIVSHNAKTGTRDQQSNRSQRQARCTHQCVLQGLCMFELRTRRERENERKSPSYDNSHKHLPRVTCRTSTINAGRKLRLNCAELPTVGKTPVCDCSVKSVCVSQ